MGVRVAIKLRPEASSRKRYPSTCSDCNTTGEVYIHIEETNHVRVFCLEHFKRFVSDIGDLSLTGREYPMTAWLPESFKKKVRGYA